MTRSIKQVNLEKKILNLLTGRSKEIAEYIFEDKEIAILQDYANIVSIKRLGFNDHGPVHMRKAALNSLVMFNLLDDAGIKLNLEAEEIGTQEDSLNAVLIAALLHDLGMTVARSKHEFMGIHIGKPIIERILAKFYAEDFTKQIVLRSLIIECIFGHMATQTVHTLEAGLVLIGDGCDMEKGRARITTILSNKPKVGDIHRYSASGIKKVIIQKGDKRPIKIIVKMDESVGFFQIEEVLFPKIQSSPIKNYIELYAGVTGQESMKYL
jgi:metal-dependent HD superfamily phosphatase/phosphodiesterase